MKNFLIDSKPNFGEAKCTLKDEKGNPTTYLLRQIKGNGCVFDVINGNAGVETDCVTFSKQDLRALYCLLTVKE
jgi:hypothetical protein